MKVVAPLTQLQQAVSQWRRERIQEGHLSAGTVTKYAANLNALAALAESRGCHEWAQLDRAILELAYSTGARNAELRALVPSDVRLDEGAVRLMGKGRRERVAYLTTTAAVAPQSWQEARTRLGVDDSAPLFVSKLLRALSDMGLWQVFDRRSRAAGIRRVHPHLMRHTFATHMVRGRADVRAVQQLMGHRSLNTTAAYLKADDEWCRSEHRNSHPLNRPTEGRKHEGSEAVSLGGMPKSSRTEPRREAVRVPPPCREAAAAEAVAGEAAGAGGAGAQARARARAKGRG